MAYEVVMPQLGLTMTEGKLVTWLKQPGDWVKKGDTLMEVETDKVLQEVASLEEGTLSSVLVGEGSTVSIGTVIAYLTAPGETVEAAATPGDAPGPPTSPTGSSAAAVSPLPRRPGEIVRASPAARKLAGKLGVDVATLRGTGPAGRIVEEDVRRAATSMPAAFQAAPAPAEADATESLPLPPQASQPPASAWRSELRGVRKVVAERMVQSFTSAPHFYITVEVDASAMVALRQQILPGMRRRSGLEPTITDLLIKAVAAALQDHPEANAAWINGGIQRNSAINLGMATATKEGLVVPVIASADQLSLEAIARRRKDLVDRARAGQLTLPDLEGGTFTVSNLGMFGIDQCQAIVNPPQAAILAVGRIKDRVAAINGQPVVRPTMFLTLSLDHRVMDGAEAAGFMARIVELIEKPAELLLSRLSGNPTE